MNITEARQVLWLKNNPRPLGELLDEGYLTEERLKWAAQWAYNPKLKEAAQVLLDQQSPRATPQQVSLQAKPFELGISLEDAQKTHWPFNPYKGEQMGSLVASKKLSLKDLGYAVESAWDPKVKRAAVALSLTRLKQVITEPENSDGKLNVVSGGRSFANWKQLQLSYFQGFIIGVFFTVFIGWGIISFFGQAKKQSVANGSSFQDLISTPTGIIALVIVLLLFIFSIWFFNFIPRKIEEKFEKQIENYRLGEEGEERVLQAILQVLDGNWTLFQNINLPGRNKADLDLVLVGPPGVWALEVKNYRGKYRNKGDHWEYRRGKVWKPLKSRPSQQALNGAARLGNFFKADGINTFVTPVVIWATEEGTLEVENPQVAVWTYDRLSDELGNIWQKEKLSKSEQEKIIWKLTKLNQEKKS
jgi:hypothetical protein